MDRQIKTHSVTLHFTGSCGLCGWSGSTTQSCEIPIEGDDEKPKPSPEVVAALQAHAEKELQRYHNETSTCVAFITVA
jgi:hypothetical protein